MGCLTRLETVARRRYSRCNNWPRAPAVETNVWSWLEIVFWCFAVLCTSARLHAGVHAFAAIYIARVSVPKLTWRAKLPIVLLRAAERQSVWLRPWKHCPYPLASAKPCLHKTPYRTIHKQP